MSIISLEHVWKSDIVIYSWSTWCSQQSYKVSICSYQDKQISVNIVWYCCDLRIQSRVLKWKCNEYYRHAKFDTYHTYSVRENCSIYVFATYQQLPSQPALQWSLNRLAFFMWVKNSTTLQYPTTWRWVASHNFLPPSTPSCSENNHPQPLHSLTPFINYITDFGLSAGPILHQCWVHC